MDKHHTKKLLQNHYSNAAHVDYQFEEASSLDVDATACVLKSSEKKWLRNVVDSYIRLSELACNQLWFVVGFFGGGVKGRSETFLNKVCYKMNVRAFKN